MYAEHALSIVIPLVVLAILWTLVRHWILPFVLGFALAVALGPSARPLIASAWAAVANVGEALFGQSRNDIADHASRIWIDVDRLPVGMTTSDPDLAKSTFSVERSPAKLTLLPSQSWGG